MNSAPGNALELALALLRAPGERHGLRGRPLPLGVDRLLAVAARVDPAEKIQETARLHGVSSALLVEAAQFYAREVLFHPQADAYRVLGVMPDASAGQVKAHHRLLQMWLHPDRQRDVDDTVFAARVNVAWNLIRNESRRRTYDEGRAAVTRLQPASPGSVPPRVAPVWIVPQADGGDATPWRSRLPFMALLGVCLLLGWLAARNNERQPEAWNLEPAGMDLDVGEQESGGRLSAAPQPAAARRLAHSPSRQRAPGQEQRTARRQSVAVAGPSTLTRETSLAPQSLVKQRLEGTTGASVPASASSRMLAEVTPKVEGPVVARPTGSARPGLDRTMVVRETRGKAPVQDDIRPGGIDVVDPIAVEPSVSEKPVSQTAAAVATLAAPSEPGIIRIQQARQVGDSLLRFLAARGRVPPPIWNSPGIMSRASGLRDDLHTAGRLRLGVPQWRIQNVSAALTSSFDVAGIEGPGSQGIVTARMTWRENRWLVSELGVERAR